MSATVRVINRASDRAGWPERLLRAGHRVEVAPIRAPADLKALGRKRPDLIAIDLERAPAHGRDLGLALRNQASTRQIPLLFVDGTDKVRAQLAELLPDAVQTVGRRIRRGVRQALAARPAAPVGAVSVMAGYSGTPLPKRLGIKPGGVVQLVRAPSGFEALLDPLPEGVRVRRRGHGAPDVTVWFVRSARELDGEISDRAARVDADRLWIAWPKKTSALAADVTERGVRAAGLDQGLVDFKICAIDADWSGLCFTRRRTTRARLGDRRQEVAGGLRRSVLFIPLLCASRGVAGSGGSRSESATSGPRWPAGPRPRGRCAFPTCG